MPQVIVNGESLKTIGVSPPGLAVGSSAPVGLIGALEVVLPQGGRLYRCRWTDRCRRGRSRGKTMVRDRKAISKGAAGGGIKVLGQLTRRDGELGDTPGRIDIPAHPGAEVACLRIGRVNGGKGLPSRSCNEDHGSIPLSKIATAIHNAAGIITASGGG